MNKEGSNQRNKRQSEQKLLDAVGTIMLRDGFKGIGINSIAKEAHLDKVLIYRYFDGLEGLLHAYARQKDFYLNTSDLLLEEIDKADHHSLTTLITRILVGQLRELIKSKELQEIMLWEMIEKNELTQAIAREREEKGHTISGKLKNRLHVEDEDTDAMIALLVSGIYYLVLRSRTVNVFNGVELDSEKGWERIENAIRVIIRSIFN